MTDDKILSISSSINIKPEEIVHKSFSVVKRGYDPGQIKAYLEQIAMELSHAIERENRLRQQLHEIQTQHSKPAEVDEETITKVLGQETAKILSSAREAARDMLARASNEAAEIKNQAEKILNQKLTEAEAEKETILDNANKSYSLIIEQAEVEKDNLLNEVKEKCRTMVTEAQSAREKILTDLVRKRRILNTQVEQLRTGKNVIFDSLIKVKEDIENLSDTLIHIEQEAKYAAEHSSLRASLEDDPTEEELIKSANEIEDFSRNDSDLKSRKNVDLYEDFPRRKPGLVSKPEPSYMSDSTKSNKIQSSDIDLDIIIKNSSSNSENLEDDGLRIIGIETTSNLYKSVASDEDTISDENTDTEADFASQESSFSQIIANDVTNNKTEQVRLTENHTAVNDDSTSNIETPETSDSLFESNVELSEQVDSPVASESITENPKNQINTKTVASQITLDDTNLLDDTDLLDDTKSSEFTSTVDHLFAQLKNNRNNKNAPGSGTDKDNITVENPDTTDKESGQITGPHDLTKEQFFSENLNSGDFSFAHFETVAKELIEPQIVNLIRKVKRALNDEQNELLDGLRRLKNSSLDSIIDREKQFSNFFNVISSILLQSENSGIQFSKIMAELTNNKTKDVEPNNFEAISNEMSDLLVNSLRQSISFDLKLKTDDEKHQLSEELSSTYREWRNEKIESVVTDYVYASFNAGILSSFDGQTKLSWLITEDERDCPDCQDNGLQKSQFSGEKWPTGQTNPPAHSGCRCILTVAFN